MSKLFLKTVYVLSLIFTLSSLNATAIEDDEITKELLENTKITTPKVNLNYNYESFEKIPIKLQILNPISTKEENVYEGMSIDFIVKEDVKYNSKILINKGEKVTGNVQTIMKRGMNGIPATIIIDDFEIKGIETNKLKSTYIRKGQNRTLIVMPIKWILTPIPVAGYVSNFIIGGHANINKKTNVVLYYYPNWGK